MNRRVLLVLLLLFLALAAVAVLQTRPQPAPSLASLRATVTAQGTPVYSRVFPDMAVLDIQAIRLRDPNSDIEFLISRGADGQWTAPDATADERLDTDTASIIARTVVLLYYERTLPLTDSTNLREYGFNPNGNLFIEVLLRNGEGHAVAIGTLSGSRTVYYALVDDRQELYLLERAPVDYLAMQLAHPPLT
ncbi:MAG: hypothetical protein HZC41_14245 [Chloroflexi bacterium]|nr:hypothetical protein [Chloroflexota bacterium]